MGKSSCCCGATPSKPCLCMKQDVMSCSAKAPMCPCYKALAEKKGAETFEDSWEKGVIRLAISSGCFTDEYAEWVERQIDGPSSTLNNPRYKKIIDKRWGLSAESKKNCGCGQDPCKTYGAEGRQEQYKLCDGCEEMRGIDEFTLSNDPQQTLTESELCDYCFGDLNFESEEVLEINEIVADMKNESKLMDIVSKRYRKDRCVGCNFRFNKNHSFWMLLMSPYRVCEQCANEDNKKWLNAESHAYSYAYNDGHSDSRKGDEYRPNLSGSRQEADFKKILKQKAETSEHPKEYNEKTGIGWAKRFLKDKKENPYKNIEWYLMMGNGERKTIKGVEYAFFGDGSALTTKENDWVLASPIRIDKKTGKGVYVSEYIRDSKGRFSEKPLLTGSVVGGLALGLIYLMRGK